MSEPLGFSQDGDVITLRMTRDDWDLVLMMLGIATTRGAIETGRCLGLVNRLNAGNPGFWPYVVEDQA